MLDGSYYEADAVIYCTGYEIKKSILDKKALDLMRYQEGTKSPLSLYKYTFPLKLKNIAMICQHEGIFIPGSELQARLACMVFTGKINLPSEDEMEKEVALVDQVRNLNLKQRAQYPYGNHYEILDNLGMFMGLLPNLEDMKEKNPCLYEKFWSNATNATHFVFKTNPEFSMDIIKQIDDISKKVYTIDSKEPRQNDFKKEFGKIYAL